MRTFILLSIILLLAACRAGEDAPAEAEPVESAAEEQAMAEAAAPEEAAPEPEDPPAGPLQSVLDAQPDEIKERYDARHPRETLEFFGIEPGMTVVEALPGGGWYTRILLPYLGSEGRLIAANYPLDMWPNFPFADEAFMERIRQWPEQFPTQTQGWCEEDCAEVDTFWFGDLPAQVEGTADAVLFVRVLHNMANFQNQGIDDYLDRAFADAFAALRTDGILGVVQHEARDDMPDEWADGSAGYLKRAFVIERAEAAGFELVGGSDINANPNDQPSTDEVVWRLPPSLRVPEDAENREALLARYEAIGESNRMTLKFRKPAGE
ncbi:MAG: methyltransferase [Gammaproteobacteria bacterium]|jgi:predicted methyltransferase|nr:methyltransferase [Gammaproteobacteria bacterium]